ncbi:MAG TPA: energy-coupling factor transporter transmembrane component T [Kiritimatiellia bacterium]|nr:energy-coupling factor transporter transmembrane component T [Kiritimatiellia bacterium]
MALLSFIDSPSPIHRIDPRARLVVCALLLAVLAVTQDLRILLAACAAGILALIAFRLPSALLARRFLALNLFLAMWWITVPWLDPKDGEYLALAATAKANAMLLLISLLVSTIDVVTLGHALAHLRIPRKLVHLLLFTARYAELLWSEQQRMQRSMRARAFRPRCDRHTYRSLIHLLGMLVVRSIDRADRILAAMKCRGYRGEFFLLHHFHFRPADALFLFIGIDLAVLLALWNWA